MLTIEKVTTREAFAALESEWNSLLPRCLSDTITLTHPWLLTWWDVFGEGRELNLLLAREDGVLVGIAPLLRRRVRRFGVPLRRLEFLASGEAEADEICSDYLDFIIETGANASFGGVFRSSGRDGTWDELLVTDIAGEAATLAPLPRTGGSARAIFCGDARADLHFRAAPDFARRSGGLDFEPET